MAHSTQSTSESEAPISSTDMEFILLIMQGHASAYSIWTYMKDNPDVRPRTTAYKNINQRLTRLARIGLLEGEVKFDVPGSTRGRRDYKVTMEGLERLIPYLIEHPEEIQTVIAYMEKIGLDKNLFGILLLEKHTGMSRLLNIYQDHTSILFDDSHWSKLVSQTERPDEIKKINENFNSEMAALLENISDSSPAQLEENKLFDRHSELVSKEDKLKSAKEREEEEAEIGGDLNRYAFDSLKELVINLFEKGFLKFNQNTQSFVTTDKGSKNLTINMIKPNEELLLAIKKSSIPFRNTIKTTKAKHDVSDDVLLLKPGSDKKKKPT